MHSITTHRSAQSCDENIQSRSFTIRWARHQFELHADRAIYWPRSATLIIADAHLGKAAAFRALGVPVPEATTQANLARLTTLLLRTAATRLLILGDLLHSATGRSAAVMRAVEQWRSEHANLNILLVRGNHDRHAGDPPLDWRIQCVNEPWIENQIAFCHDGAATCAARAGVPYAMAGHVHPCAILRDPDGSAARVMCFHVQPKLITLPSFGEFTGSHPIEPRKGDRVFALAGASILEVKSKLARARSRRSKRKTPRKSSA